MIQINLLPIRVKKKQELARQFISAYLLTIGLVLAVSGYLWISSDREIESLTIKLDYLKKDVAKYAKFDAALAELTRRKALVDKKREIINNLQTDRDSVVRVLSLLAIQVPPDKIWFEKLTQTGNSMTVGGVALSNEAIVEFMRNLESSPYVEKGSINLVHSRQATMQDMKLREFQVSYRFHPFSEVQKKLKM
ncbi:MAG: PilN domain-containing protein [Syntrophobacteraceae bacterium]